MTDLVLARNVGALIDLVRAGAASTATAGGAGDATAVTGVGIDRMGFGSGQFPQGGSLAFSALVGIAFTATLAAGKALNMALTVNHSPDNATWTPLQVFPSTQFAFSAAGGTVLGVANFQVSLTSAQRYVQFVWTPDLTAASIDTASIFPMVALGGWDRNPSPN